MTKRHADHWMRKDAPFRNDLPARSRLCEMLPFVIGKKLVMGDVIPNPHGTEAAYGLCKCLKLFEFYSDQNRRNGLNRPRPTI